MMKMFTPIRNVFFLLFLLLPVQRMAAEDIGITLTNFPDKTFRNYLLSQPFGEDGELTDEEIEGITELNLTNMGIKSLVGIAYFTNLYYLNCDSNQLSKLPINKNTQLKGLNCSFNQLTKLDISQNTKLDWLCCNNNQLTTLDVSNNTNLKELICGNNKLSNLDISNNAQLYWLECWSCQLTALDISKNTALQYLDCYGNQLTSLDVSNNIALETLYFSNNKVTSLDLSHNTELVRLSFYSNQLKELDISNNTKLSYLYCAYNQLTSLDVSHNKKLEGLYCHNNQLTALDVSNNPALDILSCSDNQIKGEAMDVLIAGLPTVDFGEIYVKNKRDNNECLSAQIAAIKAKGWTPFFYCVIGNAYQWIEMSEYEAKKNVIYTQTIDDVTYTLSHEMTDKYEVNANPEPVGGWFYKSNLILDVEKDGKTETILLDDQIFTGEVMDPAYQPSMLFDMDARKLYVFCVSKDSYYDYGMDGFAYTCSLDNMTFTKKKVFDRANWGWYSGFMGLRNGTPVLTHVSFAGYIAMVSTSSKQGIWTSIKERYFPGHDDYIPIWYQQQHVLVVGNDYGWVTEDQYQDAREAIPTNSKFRIYTMYDGKKYYLTATGTLTESVDDSEEFLYKQVKASTLYASPGWKLNVPFTNPELTAGMAGQLFLSGSIRTDASNRNDWEGQVWYKKGNCYAVRSTNALSVTYGANTFWDVMDIMPENGDGQPEAGYSFKPNFIWQLEEENAENGIDEIAVESLQPSEGDVIIYNLAGQRQATLQKGINIINHKKVFIR